MQPSNHRIGAVDERLHLRIVERLLRAATNMPTQLVLSCEHAGNEVPTAYRALFRNARKMLAGHRGWDPGALAIAKQFKRRCGAPLFLSTVTRLLVEPNRSVAHRHLFSEFTKGLDRPAKESILRQYYYPHRDRVEAEIEFHVQKKHCVVHLSLHTFTPRLDGRSRNADVGLLYDPQRPQEKTLCEDWHSNLKSLRPELRIRRNYPYLGKADGFTTYLRRRFGAAYAGIELEVNQSWLAMSAADWRRLQCGLSDSFAAILPS